MRGSAQGCGRPLTRPQARALHAQTAHQAGRAAQRRHAGGRPSHEIAARRDRGGAPTARARPPPQPTGGRSLGDLDRAGPARGRNPEQDGRLWGTAAAMQRSPRFPGLREAPRSVHDPRDPARLRALVRSHSVSPEIASDSRRPRPVFRAVWHIRRRMAARPAPQRATCPPARRARPATRSRAQRGAALAATARPCRSRAASATARYSTSSATGTTRSIVAMPNAPATRPPTTGPTSLPMSSPL